MEYNLIDTQMDNLSTAVSEIHPQRSILLSCKKEQLIKICFRRLNTADNEQRKVENFKMVEY